METNRLRQFKVVAELRNLRRAAEVLNLSHSALSKSLKVLSEQIGRPLLIQKGRNIGISEYGLSLLPQIDELLRAEDHLIRRESHVGRPIRIATFEVFSTHMIGNIWGRYFPESELELREMLPGQLELAIVDGISNYGVTYEPIPTRGVEFTLMGEIEMGVYGRSKKFAGRSLDELPFVAPISPISGSPSGAKGLDGWPENAMPRKVKFRVDLMETGLALARAGEAVIFAADFVIHHHNVGLLQSHQLEKITPPRGLKKIKRNVFMINREATAEDAELRQFAKLVRNECIRPERPR